MLSLALKNEVGGGAAGGMISFELVSVDPAKEIAVCPRSATAAETMRVFLIMCTYPILSKAKAKRAWIRSSYGLIRFSSALSMAFRPFLWPLSLGTE
jgi:hypothetical protein